MQGIRLPSFGVFEPEKIPEDWLDFIKLGYQEWNYEAFGKKWTFASLQEWEQREISKITSGLDPLAREKFLRVEILTASIVKVEDLRTNHIFDFGSSDNKVILRNILLGANARVVSDLYDAYVTGEAYSRESFIKRFGDIKERLSKDFFGFAGEFLKTSDSKTQKTKDSSK